MVVVVVADVAAVAVVVAFVVAVAVAAVVTCDETKNGRVALPSMVLVC